MSLFDDDRPVPAAATSPHAVGQDISRLSVAELAERIALLRQEVVRLEAAMAEKSAHLGAADQLFRS